MNDTNDLAKLFEGEETAELQQNLDEFRKLKLKEWKLQEELEDIKQKRIAAEETLYLSLEDANYRLIETKEGTFSRRDFFFANFAPGRKEEGYKWLRELGYGDMIQTTVNANTFSAFINDLKKSDKMLELPDFVNTGIRKKINVTGLRNKKINDRLKKNGK